MLTNTTKNYSDSYCVYQLNAQGYRCPEFHTVDWTQSVVLLGCSQVFGVAIPEEHTLASQLNLRLGVPVINLGIPGASNGSISRISVELHRTGVRPAAIVIGWTEHTRYYHDLGDTWQDYSATKPTALWRAWVMDDQRVITDNLRWRRLGTYIWHSVQVPVIEYATMSDFFTDRLGIGWQKLFDWQNTKALDGAHYDLDYNSWLAKTLVRRYKALNTLAI